MVTTGEAQAAAIQDGFSAMGNAVIAAQKEKSAIELKVHNDLLEERAAVRLADIKHKDKAMKLEIIQMMAEGDAKQQALENLLAA